MPLNQKPKDGGAAAGSSLLEMTSIVKSFNGVPVLENVNIRLERGEVVGLLGENGAGKSTLIKILCGVYQAEGGTIHIEGRATHVKDPSHAQELGIRTVYQELSLFPTMRVYENIFMNSELSQGSKSLLAPLETRRMIRVAHALLKDRLLVEIDVTRLVEELTLAEQQLVEIARAVYADAKILILDEPTTTLEQREKEQLFKVMSDLKAQGTSIIFISHHLEEVMEVCDRVVVLRDGVVVEDGDTARVDVRSMIRAMTGKALDKQYPKVPMELGDTMLSVKGLSLSRAYYDISFDLRESEILGIVGLVGCGKSELVRSLFGSVRHESGSISVRGKEVAIRHIRDAMKHRLSYLPSDRKTEGIFGVRSVEWNMTITSLKQFAKRFRIDGRTERSIVTDRISDFGIKLSSPSQTITRLSGGNQQKVLFARSLMSSPSILLLEEPTRGIDVHSKTDVYRLITEFVSQHNSVILVSSEESEVMGMCDRILVMREGRIRASLPSSEATIEGIKFYAMSGGDVEDVSES